MDSSTSIIILVFLLIMTAFFVASEFAIIKIRRTRVEQLIAEGNKKAVKVKSVIDNLDGYLSACQLGITITALGIGWIGEPAVAKIIEPLFAKIGVPEVLVHSVSFVIAFSFITFLHVVLGELAPKTVAIQKAEKVSFLFAGPLILFYKVMYPFIWALNGTANSLVRMFGLKPASEEEEHTAEEVKMIVSTSPNLEPDEQEMLTKIFDFHERFLREVMIHRTDMDCIYLTDDLEENLTYIKKSTHSRFPVLGEDKDDVIGYITIKDVYRAKEEGTVQLEKLIRKMPMLHETTSVKKALRLMQENKHQMAIVIDEYGGVSGLVTLEDIVEVIVGEIQDEFDDETASFITTEQGVIVDGSVLVDDVNAHFHMHLEELDGVDTVAGYVLTKIEDTPKIGMTIDVQNYTVRIEEMDDFRIMNLLFIKREESNIEEQEQEVQN